MAIAMKWYFIMIAIELRSSEYNKSAKVVESINEDLNKASREKKR